MARKPKSTTRKPQKYKDDKPLIFNLPDPERHPNDPLLNGPTELPVLLQPSVIVFPHTISPLVVIQADDIKTVDESANTHRLLVIIPDVTEIKREGLLAESGDVELDVIPYNAQTISRVATIVRIIKTLRFPDGTIRILVRGLERVEIRGIPSENSAPLRMIVDLFPYPKEEKSEHIQALASTVLQQFYEIIDLAPQFPDEMKVAMMNVENHHRMVDLIIDTLSISQYEKLALLSMNNLEQRLMSVALILGREIDLLKLGSKIQNRVNDSIQKQQREHYLHEQLDAIKKELGDEHANADVATFKKRMAELKPPKHVIDVIEKECERMSNIPSISPEYQVSFNYIDTLLSIPWSNKSEDQLNVNQAAEILDADHYGLKKVKDRILETLAVFQLKKDAKRAPILCFIGPPGVGKTSLGKSIAAAMGRQFVRISLGGVHDEAEIRGHRRTYIGALPGRVINGMKRAGTINPVFMLDELDKLASDFRGDPSSALLEVLDPEQNFAFNDHFIDLDYDLSNVFFIATANVADMIPPALYDRMEIIYLSGYTQFEKHKIFEQFLLPRVVEELGLEHEKIVFKSEAIDEMISYYTCEAGVRTLERTLASFLRKFIRKRLQKEFKTQKKYNFSAKDVTNLLGVRQIFMDEANKKSEIGVATGMAWTAAGGDILNIETIKMAGKGDLKLTGSLGEVMKESAQAAYSFIKANAQKYHLNASVFEKNDFHIHVPDGATPKDGPSAGVTITAALMSLLTERPLNCHFAMTGEITLRGTVTPVGGVKQKCMAALRAGITHIILPEKNKKDLEDIPNEVKDKITFHFVSHADEALALLLEPKTIKKGVKNGKKSKSN